MELLYMLENIRCEVLSELCLIITKFGEEAVIFAILCLIYWCINKNLGYRISFAYLISGLIVNVAKILLKIPRPFVRDKSFTPVEKALKKATGYSFPSGHTQSATSVYGTLALNLGRKKKIFGILLFIPVILIGFSRMYLGVHTPYDVAAGFLIGIIVTFIVDYFFNQYSMDASHYKIVMTVFIILGAGLMGLGFYEMHYENVPAVYGLDCMKIGSSILGFIIGWYIEVSRIKFNPVGIEFKWQILKYITGMCGLLVFYVGLKSLLKVLLGDESLIVNTVPYFLVTFWTTGIFPIIIKKVFTSPYSFRR